MASHLALMLLFIALKEEFIPCLLADPAIGVALGRGIVLEAFPNPGKLPTGFGVAG